MTKAVPKRKVYSALNGMRGMAALAVALFHSRPLFGVQLAPGGYLAVDLFFVLSGFVIAHAYGDRLQSELSVWEFAKIRLIRFYPLYLLGLMLGILLSVLLIVFESSSALSISTLAMAIVLGIIFLPVVGGGDIFPLNVPAWSLFYELIVNILYALVYRWLTVGVILTIVAVSLLGLSYGVFKAGGADIGPAVVDAPWTLARTVFSFGAGLLIYHRHQSNGYNPIFVIVLATMVFFVPVPTAYRPIFDIIAIVIIFPGVVYLLAGATSEKFQEVFEALGVISFGVYAVHYPIIWLINGSADKLGYSPVLAGVLMLVTVSAGSWYVDRYYDQPIRTWLKNRYLTKQGFSH